MAEGHAPCAQNLKDKSFKQPANLVEVTVCRDSGLLPSDACALDPRGDRTVRVTLSAHDVPTTQCTAHKLVEICNASGHVANEFCAQVPGNATHKAALLDVSRAFPKNGVVVLDQAYAILTGDLPAGYYAAVSPDVDSINVECYIHSEDDLPGTGTGGRREEDDEILVRRVRPSGTALQTATEPPNQTDKESNMWLADSWKDYEVLDTSAGEKLERWGKYILVRPDPQVIWNTPKDDPLWRV